MSIDFASPLSGLWLTASKYKASGLAPAKIKNQLLRTEAAQEHAHKPLAVKQRLPITGTLGSYQADILFFPNYATYNNNYKMILMVEHIPSRKLYAYPMKFKTEAYDHFVTLLSQLPPDQKMTFLETDKGSEFVNKKLQDLLDKHNVTVHNTLVKTHMGLIERLNGTIRMLIERYLTANNTYKWVDALPDIVRNYNSSIHSTTRVAPDDFTADDFARERLGQLQKSVNIQQRIAALLKPGDHVRVKAHKNLFEKGATPTFGKQVYTVVSFSPPKSFTVKDSHNEEKTVAYEDLLRIPPTPTAPAPAAPLPTRKTLKKQTKIAQQEKSEGIKTANIKTSKRTPKPKVDADFVAEPPAELVKHPKPKKPKKWVIEAIVGKRERDGKIEYEIKWEGYADTTWEPRKTLMQDAPKLVKQFDAKNPEPGPTPLHMHSMHM